MRNASPARRAAALVSVALAGGCTGVGHTITTVRAAAPAQPTVAPVQRQPAARPSILPSTPEPAAPARPSARPSLRPVVDGLGDCPRLPRQTNDQKVVEDYVDFLETGHMQYVAGAPTHLSVPAASVGPVQLRIRCSYRRLNDLTQQMTPNPRDGDAAFLAPGTPVHAIHGWPTKCRLTVRQGTTWRVYIAFTSSPPYHPAGCR